MIYSLSLTANISRMKKYGLKSSSRILIYSMLIMILSSSTCGSNENDHNDLIGTYSGEVIYTYQEVIGGEYFEEVLSESATLTITYDGIYSVTATGLLNRAVSNYDDPYNKVENASILTNNFHQDNIQSRNISIRSNSENNHIELDYEETFIAKASLEMIHFEGS